MYRALFVAAALITGVFTPGSPSGAAQTAANFLPSALTIHVKNFKFEPASVKVRAGDRVSFINDDDEAHTVTADDKSFDSEGLDGGQTWQHVFSKPGTYTYFCEMHPYMKAQIVVLAAAGDSR